MPKLNAIQSTFRRSTAFQQMSVGFANYKIPVLCPDKSCHRSFGTNLTRRELWQIILHENISSSIQIN
jgi:hypothetical protein